MKALVLADKYAHAMAAYRLESLYGTSESYTLKKADECDEAFDALAAELRRLAAVEAELERIKSLEPVAWCLGNPEFADSSNVFLANEFTPDGEHEDEWTALYALGSKT